MPEVYSKAGVECDICGIISFDHIHPEGGKPKDFIMVTEGIVEEYAMENIQTERNRIFLILSRLVKTGETITEEILMKVILGNRK